MVAAGIAGAASAVPPKTPSKRLRISIAKPYSAKESSAKTVDGSLPVERLTVLLDEKAARPQRKKPVRMGDLKGWRAFICNDVASCALVPAA